MLPGDGAPHPQHLSSQHPPHQTHGVGTLVVAWDGNVDVSQRGVGVAEGNGWDVDVRGFSQRL
ncbi:hypothetical protein MZO44_15880, partial [Lactiplantibacillus sp. E932]|nr:hypothetical protein [Lactiplantibacillus sp. E932]